METMRMHAVSVFAVTLGALLSAVGFNLFLIPHEMLTGGVSGVAMIIGYLTSWNIGILYFVINLPLLIWGWLIIGKRFVLLSILSVVLTTWMMQLIPEYAVANDSLISSVFGGVLVGVASGISLRSGGSTGGFDIVGSILTRNRDFPLGMLLLGMNGLVVLVLGYTKTWDLALSSMLSIYITAKIVDTIHVRHIKVTAFIITNRKEELLERLLKSPRGVTLVKTTGAFTRTERDMLMTVTTRYELAELKKNVKETDPTAFVNIVETVEVMGEFRRVH